VLVTTRCFAFLLLVACQSRPDAAPLGVRPEVVPSARPALRADEPILSEAAAIAKVSALPEVAELRAQDWTPAHPEGLGRNVRPVVKTQAQVEPGCRDEDCLYTIDVVDETEIGTPRPALRFFLHARTSALSIERDAPYPKGPMDYASFRKLDA
jgi:hypothetical protein